MGNLISNIFKQSFTNLMAENGDQQDQ